MPPKMSRCEDCGKLFTPAPKKTLCDACTRNRMPHTERVREAVLDMGLETPHEIALATGIPADDVAAILARLDLPHQEIRPEALCARCKRTASSNASPFCNKCRTELDRLFGEAARILQEKIAMAQREAPGKKSGTRMSTREALEKKRLRTTDHGRGPAGR